LKLYWLNSMLRCSIDWKAYFNSELFFDEYAFKVIHYKDFFLTYFKHGKKLYSVLKMSLVLNFLLYLFNQFLYHLTFYHFKLLLY
jgi:hypothetical protein